MNREEFFHYAVHQMPREACGLGIIEKGRERIIPCKNIAEKKNDFAICPRDYLNAFRRGEIIRVYHSHCHVSPRPSEADLVACEASGLPWAIVSVPGGTWNDFKPSGYKAPLVGRTWSHGVLDCYSLIRDFYSQELGISLPDFEREEEWWLKNKNLYEDNFQKAGFFEVPLSDIQTNDVVLFQILSPVTNHGAIYLGNEIILHHLHGRLSCREILGGYYSKNISKILRFNHEKN